MNGQQNLSWILILAIIGLIIILASRQPSQYIPTASLDLSQNSITVNDNQPSQIITATVTKTDDKNIPTIFTLKFQASNVDFISVLDAESNQKITESQTEPLTEKGRQFIKQFKVVGKKIGGQPESPWFVTIYLIYNSSAINMPGQRLDVIVK